MDKNLELVFVRHGESNGNIGKADPGFHPEDPRLTPLGLLQAQKLADRFSPGEFSAIYASSLLRTCQTVQPTAEKLGMSVRVLRELMEVNTAIPNADPALIERHAPNAYADFCRAAGEEIRFPLVNQTQAQCAARGAYCMETILSAASEGERILICTHGGFIGYLLRYCLGISLPETFNWQIDNAALFHIKMYADKIPKLAAANDISHLKE